MREVVDLVLGCLSIKIKIVNNTKIDMLFEYVAG